MKIVTETSLASFNAWSGGASTLSVLVDRLSSSELDNLESQIEEAIGGTDGEITDAELNDFLWFESDTIANMLGYDSWEAFANPSEEDDEEEDEDEEEDNEED